VSEIGIHIRKHDEQVCLNRIRDPKLAAIEQEVVAVVYSAACEGKCVAAGAGFGQCIGADEVLRQAWQILAFLPIVGPAHESVVKGTRVSAWTSVSLLIPTPRGRAGKIAYYNSPSHRL